MALDEDLEKACKCLEVQKVTGGKIGICNKVSEKRYLCTGTTMEQRGQDKGGVYVLYVNIGAVAECKDNPIDNSVLAYF